MCGGFLPPGLRGATFPAEAGEGQAAAADPAAGVVHLVGQGLGDGNLLQVQNSVAAVADEVDMGRGLGIEALRAVDTAHGGNQPLLLEQVQIPVHRSQGDIRVGLPKHLVDHLRQAEHYIFLEYYILAEGQIWERIFSVLKERAAAGVEIHIIFDDFGNLTRLSDATLQAMQDAGIEVAVFNPVHRYVNRIYFNYRDHRKITVIDGQYAYTGGINIADEYANLIVRFGHWKDTGVRIEGDGAWGFASQFIRMWKMMSRTLHNEDDYYRPRREFTGSGWCQPFADGPLNNPDNPIEETYLQLFASAKRMLYITTPYYAVEESMQQALCIAADAGVDVRLMVPAVPDKKYAYMVAETYWGELLAHGVKIYKYAPGFVHAKSVMVDREVALVGSTNMDYRTFQLHYECAVLMYHMPVVEELLEDMDDMMSKSKQYTLEEWNSRSWMRKMFSSILRLGAIFL